MSAIPSRWVTLCSYSFAIDKVTGLHTEKYEKKPWVDLVVCMEGDATMRFSFRDDDYIERAEAARDFILEKLAVWEHHVAARTAPKQYNPTIIYACPPSKKRRRQSL